MQENTKFTCIVFGSASITIQACVLHMHDISSLTIMHTATTAGAVTSQQHAADLVISESPAFMRLGVSPFPPVSQVGAVASIHRPTFTAQHTFLRARKGL